MKAAEMLDFIEQKLLAQGRRSMLDKDVCAYRAPNGDRCAVGHLIPDALYQEAFERRTVSALLSQFPKLQEILLPSDLPLVKALNFLDTVQSVHDTTKDEIFVDSLHAKFRKIRKEFSL